MGPEGTEPGAFLVYCDGVPLHGIEELQLPELSQEVFVADLPIVEQYILHCTEKGWKPSERGLLGFVKLLRLGYYKTL